jgi:hypothetical protein
MPEQSDDLFMCRLIDASRRIRRVLPLFRILNSEAQKDVLFQTFQSAVDGFVTHCWDAYHERVKAIGIDPCKLSVKIIHRYK